MNSDGARDAPQIMPGVLQEIMKKRYVYGAIILIGLCSICSAAPYESDYLTIRTEGNGPDVILIPGLASSAEVWAGVVTHLKEKYRLHIVSIAGFAGNSAPEEAPQSYLETLPNELLRYIEESELKQPVLIGHSMGGLTALLVGAGDSRKISNIVVVDSLPFYSLLFNPLATSEQVIGRAIDLEKVLVNMNDERFARTIRASVSILTKSKERVNLLSDWVTASDRNVYAQLTREVIAYDARPKLKTISCPVHVIYAYDRAMPLPEEMLRKLYSDSYASLSDITIQQVSDSYHFIMWDNPGDFEASLKNALSPKSNSE